MRCLDVVPPIANHLRLLLEPLGRQHMANQLSLVAILAGELRAIDRDEGVGQTEVVEYFPGVYVRLGRHYTQLVSRALQLPEPGDYARVNGILEHPHRHKSLSVEANCSVEHLGIRAPEQLGERATERRPHTPTQLPRGRNGCAEGRQRMLQAPRDAKPRIGQCSVEIEE